MPGSFEWQGFEPCDSEPKTHPDILSGKTLPIEELPNFFNGYTLFPLKPKMQTSSYTGIFDNIAAQIIYGWRF